MPSNRLYNKLCTTKTLNAAWKTVRQNGLQSQSLETQEAIEKFSSNASAELSIIRNQLKAQSFRFTPARGILVQKKDKSKKRPIVLAPIQNRVVQRAILDVLLTRPKIKRIQKARFNFGGIAKLGVPDAIAAAHQASQHCDYFIRTDIQSFFDNVPREKAVQLLCDAVGEDNAFKELLIRATNTELDNLASMTEAERKLFPLEDRGVAQGSSLSPLICNVLLHDFDKKNGRGVVCIRYIDDFILFAPTGKKAHAALKSARKILADLHLDAYDPKTNKEKAEEGFVNDGYNFLGCWLDKTHVNPANGSSTKVLDKIQNQCKEALKLTTNPIKALRLRQTYSDTLIKIGRIIQGWGNTYFFCNDPRYFRNMENQITSLVLNFSQNYSKKIKAQNDVQKRILLGVRLLEDRKIDTDFINRPLR